MIALFRPRIQIPPKINERVRGAFFQFSLGGCMQAGQYVQLPFLVDKSNFLCRRFISISIELRSM